MRDHDGLTFPIDEYERRIRELRERMGERNIDAMIVSDPENLFYLTGHQTTGYSHLQALVVPIDAEPYMVMRLLEETNIGPRTWVEKTWTYHDTGDPVETLYNALHETGLSDQTIGYERSSYFFPTYLEDQFTATLMDAELVDCAGIVEQGRARKSPVEIELMYRAAKATEAGMQAGIDAVAAGVTENDIAAATHQAMFAAGGEYPAVVPYITSGPRCCIGHATWEGREVQPDECVFLEGAGCVRRYHTAMMRTVFVGQPPDEMFEAEATVLQALKAMKKTMKPGRTAAEVDHAAREVISAQSPSGNLLTRSGYMIGIAFAPSWDEGYMLSLMPGEDTVLQEGMTFHIIPWIHGIEGDHVMGISDTVRVTDDGCESFFTMEPKFTWTEA